ncbi:Leucine-rich repeat protein kinase family protein [Perilla frutescens var. frutescens]|nr:Leucine-rich repeat protein kinase family protein [Perilla frutescens var. frutescens]
MVSGTEFFREGGEKLSTLQLQTSRRKRQGSAAEVNLKSPEKMVTPLTSSSCAQPDTKPLRSGGAATCALPQHAAACVQCGVARSPLPCPALSLPTPVTLRRRKRSSPSPFICTGLGCLLQPIGRCRTLTGRCCWRWCRHADEDVVGGGGVGEVMKKTMNSLI